MFLRVEDKNGALIVGLETVSCTKRLADGAGELVMVETLRVEPDTVEVVVIFDDIHRIEGNVDGAIVVAVTFLHSRFNDADDLESYPVDPDVFVDRRHAREKFVPGLGTNDRVKAVTHVVGVIKEAPFFHVQIPDFFNGRIETGDGKCE